MTPDQPLPQPSAAPWSGTSHQPFSQPDTRPGLLLIADTWTSADAGALADAAGLRLLDRVPLDRAAERLDRQIGGEVALLVCGGEDVALERLLVQLETMAVQAQMRLIVVAPPARLDLAFACTRLPATQLLCDPAPADLAAALILAAQQAGPARSVHDFGRESDGARLQQLSEEVGRLARTIEALTRGGQPAGASAFPQPSFVLPPRISDRSSDYIGMPAMSPLGAPAPVDEEALDAATVRDLIRARRMRADVLPDDLFADPAWDMMLDLLAARLEHERVSVSSLCIASAVPPTTALRWIRTLTERGMLMRQADPHDGRRVFIALSDEAAQALCRWFAASRRFRCRPANA